MLEIPKQVGFTEPTSLGSVSPSSKILVEDQVFDIKDSTIASLLLGKLRSTEGGSFQFPNEWNVHATQFSVLSDHLQSGK